MQSISRCSLISPSYPLSLIKRYAGHSKWQNIRHTKGAKDLERSKIFQQFCQRIRVAIQEGGSADPNKNLQLRQAVEQARRQNMPVATIDNHLKAAKENKDNSKSVWYEVRGVKGSCLLVSAVTPQAQALRYAMAAILKKHRAEFADNTVKRTFENKGVIVARPPLPGANALDTAVADAIEVGAEEVEPSETDDETLKFVCQMNEMDVVRTKLAALKYTIETSEFSLIPKVVAQMSQPELELMDKLIGKIEELPEVVKVYDNIVWSTET